MGYLWDQKSEAFTMQHDFPVYSPSQTIQYAFCPLARDLQYNSHRYPNELTNSDLV